MGSIYRNAELERRLQERLFIRTAARHEARIRRELVKQYRDAAKSVESGRGRGFSESDRLITAVSGVMRDSYETFGRRTASAIKESLGRSGKRAIPMSPEFEEGMNRYIRMYAGRKVKDVDATTKARIAIVVQRGIDEGWTNREVSDAIREMGLIDSSFRARVIARTESHSGANAGSAASAAETGVVQEKEWINAEDERVRDGSEGPWDHTGVKNVPMDQSFVVSGENLEYPGDPSGSAGNVINCRCAIGYVV